MLRKIRQIVIVALLLLCAGVAFGANLAKTNKLDTLTVEEQQQFLYYLYEAQRLIEK